MTNQTQNKYKNIICIPAPVKKNVVKPTIVKHRITSIDLGTGNKVLQTTKRVVNRDRDALFNSYIYQLIPPLKTDMMSEEELQPDMLPTQRFIKVSDMVYMLNPNTLISYNMMKKEGQKVYITEVDMDDILNKSRLSYNNPILVTPYRSNGTRDDRLGTCIASIHPKMIISYDEQLAVRVSSICKLLADYMIKYYKYMVDNKKIVPFLDVFFEMAAGRPLTEDDNYEFNTLIYSIYQQIFRQPEKVLQTLYKIYHTDEDNIEFYMEINYDTVFLTRKRGPIVPYTDLARTNYTAFQPFKLDLDKIVDFGVDFESDLAIKHLYDSLYDKDAYFKVL